MATSTKSIPVDAANEAAFRSGMSEETATTTNPSGGDIPPSGLKRDNHHPTTNPVTDPDTLGTSAKPYESLFKPDRI